MLLLTIGILSFEPVSLNDYDVEYNDGWLFEKEEKSEINLLNLVRTNSTRILNLFVSEFLFKKKQVLTCFHSLSPQMLA